MYWMLSQEFVNQYKDKEVPWGYGLLSEIVYKRTYARRIDEENRTEEWFETIARCINGAQAIGADYTQEELERLYDYMFNLKAIYAGRMLWRLGTNDALSKYGDSLVNCWGVVVNSVDSFCFSFDQLMKGGGVGFSVRRQDVAELPKIKKGVTVVHESTKDGDFIVPDSREGWVRLLRNVLDAFFKTGKGFTYSTILVRGAGEPIKGFGGTASGPIVLVDGIAQIVKVLQSREGKKLRSVDALDIMNIIGSVVVAGNVRRSAQIALGDSDDILFLRAKRWDMGGIPNWRAFSNNTIYADTYDYLTDEFWTTYNGNSEPLGLFNLDLAQTNGRTGEERYDSAEIMNPCGEIPLSPFEACNLAEIPLNNVNSLEELKDIARLLYKTQKAVAAMPYQWEQTNTVVHKNMKLGLGDTGVCQSLHKLGWLSPTYEMLREFDEEWSKQHGWPTSIRLTTAKPSGTVSLLTGSTPGIHPALYQYYIRRVQMSSNDPLVKVCKDRGLHTEYKRRFDGSEDHGTIVVEFPCFSGENVITSETMGAIQQLELLKFVQQNWADNSVSCTVYYRKEELPEIQGWLQNNYETSIKSVSFLLRNEHGFDQAPYEEITRDRYLEITDSLELKEMLNLYSPEMLELDECSTGACPVR